MNQAMTHIVEAFHTGTTYIVVSFLQFKIVSIRTNTDRKVPARKAAHGADCYHNHHDDLYAVCPHSSIPTPHIHECVHADLSDASTSSG
jgi:hypothetical protein